MVTNQAYLFCIFIINGIVIGLLFDFFRIARKVISTNDMVTYLEDILFWILAGATVLYSIFVFNNGELRLFLFLGIIVGAIFYLLCISSYMIKTNIKIINIVKKILEIFLMPFKFLYKTLQKLLFKPIYFIFINSRKKFANFGTKIYKKVKPTKKCKKIENKKGILKNM